MLMHVHVPSQDSVIAIDLEWRPETAKGQFNKVALVQISSATVCVLIRTASMGFQLPDAVRSLLADPTTVVVGFAWEAADEQKLTRSFGFGKANFGRFFDLADVCRDMGYPHMSLLRFTNRILGVTMTKSKAISRSRWDARELSPNQIKYAALDVFATGQVRLRRVPVVPASVPSFLLFPCFPLSLRGSSCPACAYPPAIHPAHGFTPVSELSPSSRHCHYSCIEAWYMATVHACSGS